MSVQLYNTTVNTASFHHENHGKIYNATQEHADYIHTSLCEVHFIPPNMMMK